MCFLKSTSFHSSIFVNFLCAFQPLGSPFIFYNPIWISLSACWHQHKWLNRSHHYSSSNLGQNDNHNITWKTVSICVVPRLIKETYVERMQIIGDVGLFLAYEKLPKNGQVKGMYTCASISKIRGILEEHIQFHSFYSPTSLWT